MVNEPNIEHPSDPILHFVLEIPLCSDSSQLKKIPDVIKRKLDQLENVVDPYFSLEVNLRSDLKPSNGFIIKSYLCKDIKKKKPKPFRYDLKKDNYLSTVNKSNTVIFDNRPKIKTIDLHGLSSHSAIETTLNAINEAANENCGKVIIIHGKGIGRLKSAIQNCLQYSTLIKSFQLDTDNTGRTIVNL